MACFNPFTTGNPFLGTKLLGYSIGRGSGALKTAFPRFGFKDLRHLRYVFLIIVERFPALLRCRGAFECGVPL